MSDLPSLGRLKSKLKLLSVGNAKLMKGLNQKVVTLGLHLAPASLSGFNVCAASTEECRETCLNLAGNGFYPSVQAARIRKTKLFFEDRQTFLDMLHRDIRNGAAIITEAGYQPAFRLNVLSDIRWELYGVPQAHPAYQMYDYTKLPNRKDLPANYHLTFSFSGHNLEACKRALANGMNVAVPFRNKPATWLGYPVVDGDEDDLRFRNVGSPVIIGLKPKGKLRSQPNSPFFGDNHEAA
jgi:hypothetical protein